MLTKNPKVVAMKSLLVLVFLFIGKELIEFCFTTVKELPEFTNWILHGSNLFIVLGTGLSYKVLSATIGVLTLQGVLLLLQRCLSSSVITSEHVQLLN